MYEAINDVYSILIPIAEANKDYKKLANIHGFVNVLIFNQLYCWAIILIMWKLYIAGILNKYENLVNFVGELYVVSMCTNILSLCINIVAFTIQWRIVGKMFILYDWTSYLVG